MGKQDDQRRWHGVGRGGGAVKITVIAVALLVLLTGVVNAAGYAPTGDVFTAPLDTAAGGDHLVGAFTGNAAGPMLSMQGVEGYVTTSHNTGDVGKVLSVIGNAEHIGAGSITDVRLFSGGMVMDDGSGNVANVYAFASHAVQRFGSPGIIQNFYGLYLGAQPKEGIGHRWGVYQAGKGTDNYFAGNVEIKGRLKVHGKTSPPQDTRTPVAWFGVNVNGEAYKIPLYR